MNQLLAVGWLVLIGTNVAAYYSEDAPYQAAIILSGALYFPFVFREQLLQMLSRGTYLFVLGVLVVPILLMLVSDRQFERGTYTSMLAVAATFVVASVLGARAEHDRAWSAAAFAIVAAAASLNLYELLVQNNTWSIAPGRSAGLYVNPNISAEVLVGYALVFLVIRAGPLAVADLTVACLTILGVFATFSRGGILGVVALLALGIWLRTGRKHLLRLILGSAALVLLTFIFASYALQNLDLSDDALARVLSLIESGGVGDYGEDRGQPALQALDLAMENPVMGNGVGAIADMPEGPHNMFLAMMVEYGFVGLVVYLLMIVSLVRIRRNADKRLSAMSLSFVAWLVIFSLTSHNLLENTATIPLLGLAVACACRIRSTPRQRGLVRGYT